MYCKFLHLNLTEGLGPAVLCTVGCSVIIQAHCTPGCQQSSSVSLSLSTSHPRVVTTKNPLRDQQMYPWVETHFWLRTTTLVPSGALLFPSLQYYPFSFSHPHFQICSPESEFLSRHLDLVLPDSNKQYFRKRLFLTENQTLEL